MFKTSLMIVAAAIGALVTITLVTDCGRSQPTSDPGGMAHPPINHPEPDAPVMLAGPGSVQKAMDAGLGSDNGVPNDCTANFCAAPF